MRQAQTALKTYTNYCSYHDSHSKKPRIGHYDLVDGQPMIYPLSFASGSPLSSLYQVIEAGETQIICCGDPIPKVQVKILPPLTGRDILCVGKNYAEHAVEFNSSGFDSSDKVDQPSHPVIFTKRFTSIIADGEDIYPHPKFTQTLDYEGEIGVIIGKPGFRISEEDAMDHVWGYTLINDVTARERQRDHKQFYIGKSADTFCPMGPIAVPKEWNKPPFIVQTHVNNEVRQHATTDDLIFSIPFLIKTLSEGQTLMPGDVIATGTPAGVGFGQNPPTYLQPGDIVQVSASGLGTLSNRIASPSVPTVISAHVPKSTISLTNSNKTPHNAGLSLINGKMLNYKRLGRSASHIIFIHGLGASMEYWTPAIKIMELESYYSFHLLDLEGHGLSPTSPLSRLSVDSFSNDLEGLFAHAHIQNAILVGHGFGCLIATQFAIRHPEKVSRMVLFGPTPTPISESYSKALFDRAAIVRREGMAGIVGPLTLAETSSNTQSSNILCISALRLSLLGQDPEAYAKACTALANSVHETQDLKRIRAKTLIVGGSQDKVSTPSYIKKLSNLMPNCTAVVLPDLGGWHVWENLQGVADTMSEFLIS